MDRVADVTRIVQGGRAKGLSDDEIRALVKRYDERTQQPKMPPPPARTRPFPMEMSQWTLDDAAEAAPHMLKAWATTVAPAVMIPGILGAAAKYGGPAVGSAVRAATSPLGSGAIGAAVGGYKGGLEGALYGGLSGYGAAKAGSTKVGELLKRLGLNKPSPMVQGMSSAAKPAADSVDDMIAAAMAKRKAANPGFWDDAAAPKPTPTAPRDALSQQVAMRDPDWRMVDAVPIDAMKRDISQGGSILRAGESRVGLAEQAAALSKNPANAAEVAELLKALRQRMHISGRK